MYRRPKFLEVLLKIREEMAREADYDVDFYVEMVRSGIQPATDVRYFIGEPDSDHANGPKALSGKKKKQRQRSTNADKTG
jgi:hypothetical protein